VSALQIAVLLRRLRAKPDGSPARETLGRCDEAALAAGLALRAAAGPRARLHAIAAGIAAREEPALVHALRRGADSALRVHDPALEGVDFWGVARALAAAVEKVGFDLVLVGDRSEDEGQGAVGPAVAERLGIPHLSGALDVRLDDAGAAVLATRRELAHVRTLRLALPALVTVAAFPDAAGTRAAEPLPEAPAADGGLETTIRAVGLDSLGIQALELKHRDRCVGRASPVRLSHNATLIRDPAQLVARLRADHLLEP
jgi:electron transfer flavoprotein alpha/beta subunit